MGNIFSRSASNDEPELDLYADLSYAYPPKDNANFFGLKFLLGGEKFDTACPENFLFGENSDLNLLGKRAVPFQSLKDQVQSAEPMRSLHCLANVRRDSIRFVKNATTQNKEPIDVSLGHINLTLEHNEDETMTNEQQRDATTTHVTYRIEFCVDADVACVCRVYYFARIDYADDHYSLPTVANATYTSADLLFDIGVNQCCASDELTFDPAKHSEQLGDEENKSAANCVYPIIIELLTQPTTQQPSMQRQLTLCTVTRVSDSTRGYVLKAWKQKLIVDNVVYLLQEVYGVENKIQSPSTADDEALGGDNSLDCVICMSELRDTLILPCRHLCVCSACADTLRFKINACPICRAPFKAILQLRTLRKLRTAASAPALSQILTKDYKEDRMGNRRFVTTHYEQLSLVEALNGPIDHQITTLTLKSGSNRSIKKDSEASPSRSCSTPSDDVHSTSSVSNRLNVPTSDDDVSNDVEMTPVDITKGKVDANDHTQLE